MPEVSRFFGIVITMYYNDHPPPHFHARYGKQKALIDIDTLSILEGKISSRARNLVNEWASLHRAELWEDWDLAREDKPLKKIDPLE